MAHRLSVSVQVWSPKSYRFRPLTIWEKLHYGKCVTSIFAVAWSRTKFLQPFASGSFRWCLVAFRIHWTYSRSPNIRVRLYLRSFQTISSLPPAAFRLPQGLPFLCLVLQVRLLVYIFLLPDPSHLVVGLSVSWLLWYPTLSILVIHSSPA